MEPNIYRVGSTHDCYCGITGPILYCRNILRFRGYNTSVAVSKPSAAIFRRILLLCIRRTMYNSKGVNAAAPNIVITMTIVPIFKSSKIYTKIMPARIFVNNLLAS
jgi:hypothetical protein